MKTRIPGEDTYPEAIIGFNHQRERFARFARSLNYHNLFSECTEAIATSIILLVTSFPEIFVFMIGFSFTVWTKMMPLLAHN